VRAREGQRVRAEGGPEVRRVRPEDWPALKALRLEALQDTPRAYGETLATGRAHPDGEWQARARRGAEGGDSCQLLAVRDGALVGTAAAFLPEPGTALLVGVYLTPGARGAGLLDRMVDALAGWAREQGAAVVRLQVHEQSAPARAAYARLGFADTGERAPYDLDPTEHELVLERAL